jgi:hypothetical protein
MRQCEEFGSSSMFLSINSPCEGNTCCVRGMGKRRLHRFALQSYDDEIALFILDRKLERRRYQSGHSCPCQVYRPILMAGLGFDQDLICRYLLFPDAALLLMTAFFWIAAQSKKWRSPLK